METYFSKFPTIEYANNQMRDLSRRVVLGNNIRAIPTAFYPYDILNEQRSDVVAHAYYKDSDIDWLIYIINGIVDPYYGWYLNEDEFNNFIIEKYGGLDIAQQTVSYWVTNWMNDDINVTIGYYNSLPELLQKYYMPVWGPKNIIAYKRRPEDWIQNVNQILNVVVSNTEPFAVNDLVQSLDIGDNIIGHGQILGIIANDHILQVGQVIDHWETDRVNSVQVRNTPPSTPAGPVEVALDIITDSEAVFWTPVYVYDMEKEINESRKTIMLLDPGYVRDAVRGVSTLLKE